MVFWPQKWSEPVAIEDPRCPLLSSELPARGHVDELALVLEGGAPTGWWLRGWTALADAPSMLDQLTLALCSDDMFFEVPVAREPRDDVARALNSEAYQHSGFRALVPAEAFPDGEFRLLVRIRGSSGDAMFDTRRSLHLRGGRPFLPERAGQPLLHVVHVPKTAGTSFRQLLERGFGGGLALHYEGPLLIGPETRCMQGHLYASSMLRYDPDVRLAMWFRDPVERVVSEYFHWRRNPETHPLGGADLLSFARRREMVNLHRRVLDDLSLERLTFVGITEHFEAGIELFCRIFDKSPVPIGTHNCNPDKAPCASYGLPASLRAEIARANRADFELYTRAKQRFYALCDQYGVALAE